MDIEMKNPTYLSFIHSFFLLLFKVMSNQCYWQKKFQTSTEMCSLNKLSGMKYLFVLICDWMHRIEPFLLNDALLVEKELLELIYGVIWQQSIFTWYWPGFVHQIRLKLFANSPGYAFDGRVTTINWRLRLSRETRSECMFNWKHSTIFRRSSIGRPTIVLFKMRSDGFTLMDKINWTIRLK